MATHLATESSCHDGTEAQAIAAIAAQAIGVQIVRDDVSGRSWLSAPDADGGVAFQEITEPGDVNPGRLSQGVTLTEPASLAAYANRFTTATGALFGSVATGVIVAALDYHNPTADSDGVTTADGPKATHNEHRATLTLQPSEEWKTWTGQNGKMVSQLEFARFIEENSPDIVTPTGADLLEIARDFHAVRAAEFRQIVRTDSDNERLEFSDGTVAGASSGGKMVDVPTTFTIAIPVYFGEPKVTLVARFRWAQEQTGLKLGLKLDRLENVRQAEFRRIMNDLADKTGFPAFFGELVAPAKPPTALGRLSGL